MTCLRCGAKMNHHADKMVDVIRPEDVEFLNPVFDGVIEEFHGCPRCGAIASRRAQV